MGAATARAAVLQLPRALKIREHLLPIVAFAAVLAAALLYVSYTGLIIYMGDSFLLANRAKHLADQLNLNSNNGLAPLIYPPLYPILMAFSYRFQDPRLIFRLILILNAVLTSSQVFPLYLLLNHYANVSRKNAALLAAAIALSPASLPYTTMVLTDVLYCPVLLWLAFFINRAVEQGRRRDFFGLGVTLALTMLTRSAASVVLVAYGITLIVYFWQRRTTGLWRGLRAVATSALSFCALYGTWLIFERFFVNYEGFMPQFTLSNVAGVFLSARRFDLHAAWFSNCLFYYLTAPLSLAGVFVFTLFVRKPGLLRRDITAVFFLTSMVVGAAVASFVTDDHWGGRELTWNRYVMPYVVFIVLMAVRYRAYFNRYFFFLCTIVMALTMVSFRPSYLGCHFTDALALFEGDRPFRASDTLLNLLYMTSAVAAGWLWLRRSRTAQRTALAITGLVWLSTHAVAAHFYRNSGDLNISSYHGLAERAYRDTQIYAHTDVYYDPEFTNADVFSALRVLFFWPNLDIRPLKRYQFAQLEPAATTHVLYFTAATLYLAPAVGEERGNIKLYDLSGDQLRQSRSQADRTRLRLDISGNFPQAEVGERDNKRYAVRWLPRETDFTGTLDAVATDAVVSLELATNGPPRTAKLIVNGAFVQETYSVTGNFWGTSSTIARFHVSLKHGLNSFRLTSVEPAGKLPDGREVAFLMIGDIQVVRANPQN